MLRWTDHRPEPEQLYWALHAIPGAAAAGDMELLDDLLTEAGIWLDRIWRHPAGTVRTKTADDFLSISTTLWAETQRGRGAEDLDQIRLHTRLLRNLAGPELPPARSSRTMLPAYRKPEDRIRGGHLPLTRRPVGPADRDLPEQFLLLLAAVLSNRGGHLSAVTSLSCPPGADAEHVGWATEHSGAAGSLLGSIAVGDQEMRLRPGPCLTAVNRSRANNGADHWLVDEIGWALADRWLVDTTLTIDSAGARRLHTCAGEVLDDHRPEQIWRLSLAVFHPHQFFPAGGPALRRGPSLRAVRPT